MSPEHSPQLFPTDAPAPARRRTTNERPRVERPALIDIPTLADQLGVGVRHIRRLVTERRVPYLKWGHLIRFDPAQIDEWLREAEHPPQGA